MSLVHPHKSKREFLIERSKMLAQTRAFFQERGVIEIDCPILNPATNIDDHIDPIKVGYLQEKQGYLHTSPELFLKKMLSIGLKDLYFLGHVFRDHEKGNHHHVEFTMVEWYRTHLNFKEMIQETLDFIQLFVGSQSQTVWTYRDALLESTGLDLVSFQKTDLLNYIHKEINPDFNPYTDTTSDLLTYIFTEKAEPLFKTQELHVVVDYPKEQAALAKTEVSAGREIAKRFEIYFNGVELANGYDELIGDLELQDRYMRLNEKRRRLGKEKLPIDEAFIQANAILPDCRGVAVGFDRLMMLKCQTKSIHETMATFPL